MLTKAKVDFLVERHSTIVWVTPLNREAMQWAVDHVDLEEWAWAGRSFAVDPRFLEDLVANLKMDGFEVRDA